MYSLLISNIKLEVINGLFKIAYVLLEEKLYNLQVDSLSMTFRIEDKTERLSVHGMLHHVNFVLA